MNVEVTGYEDVSLPDDTFAALTVYAESGGTFKTTTTANTAKALSRKGLDVLVNDFDPQEGCLSYLFDLVDDKDNPDADNIVRHIGNRPRGDFDDLIRPSGEGFDVIPSHNSLLRFSEQIRQLEDQAKLHGDEDSFNEHAQLQQLFAENDVPSKYDVLLIDPQATPSPKLYNAIYATRTLLSPVETSGKGALSLDGLQELSEGLEQRLGINVGIAGVVPGNVGGTNISENYNEQLEAEAWDVPVVIGQRESLMKEMWEARATAYTVVEEEIQEGKPGARDVPERELETLAKYDRLADHIIDQYAPRQEVPA